MLMIVKDEMKTWRLLDEGGAATEPLDAEEIVARLWSSETGVLWTQPTEAAEPALATDVPEIRKLLLMDTNGLLTRGSSIRAQKFLPGFQCLCSSCANSIRAKHGRSFSLWSSRHAMTKSLQ